jgi:8-oxo-dGTP diphosphatase
MSAARSATMTVRLRLSVHAAGGLVIRRGPDGAARVVLIHRPRDGGWAFPHGKQRRAESLSQAAQRQVQARTGFLCVPEANLGVTEYLDRRGRPRLVRYWAMDRLRGEFEPTDDVDQIAWLRPPEALLRLSHDHDRELLQSALPQLDAVLDRRGHVETASLA